MLAYHWNNVSYMKCMMFSYMLSYIIFSRLQHEESLEMQS